MSVVPGSRARALLADRVAWHDLECGRYTADLPLWREFAGGAGGRVLDVGAGTGRVALPLASAGVEVTAVDLDPEMLAALAARSAGLPLAARQADARRLPPLGGPFALVLAPMQTVQLLGGAAGRAGFLAGAARVLRPGGRLAVALAAALEPFGPGDALPLPDVTERDGWVLSSQPVAARADDESWVMERRRLVVGPDGDRAEGRDLVVLDALTPAELEREAARHGLLPGGRREIAETSEHVGSDVVVLSRG